MVDPTVFEDATVLVVDDNPQSLDLFERIFTMAGTPRVITTRDPTRVVALCLTHQPDLLVIDLHMPKMDGFELMRAVAEQPTLPDYLPILVLTADATDDTRDRALASGAHDFLTKPVDRTEVLLRARNLLVTRSLQDRLAAQNVRLRSELLGRHREENRRRAATVEKRRQIQLVLDAGGPRIVLQPIVELGTDEVVGFEALSRFDVEPVRPPDTWFAEAAEVGLDLDLEIAAVRAALRCLADLDPSAFISLNISPKAALAAEMLTLLAAHPVDRIVLELTEHARVHDYGHLHRMLSPLRDRGLRIAVDDAGAGFAGLNHILRLRPDIIKLDMSLVRDIGVDPVKRALASSLVAFSREIEASLTAEGVETADERDTLLDLRIDCGQGYLFGRPHSLSATR